MGRDTAPWGPVTRTTARSTAIPTARHSPFGTLVARWYQSYSSTRGIMSITEVTMRRLSFAFAAVAVVALSAGCYPDRSVSSAAQLDLVLTQVNPNAVFRGVSTYSLADSIVHLIPEGSEDTLSRAYDQLILNTVKSNLDGLGWTEI